jgi:3-hydroxyisobutyrate dehydrogenase/glyoxylate/succinic semialdehyde reductase
MLRGTAMAAFGEVLKFGDTLGIDKAELIDSLLSSDMAAPFLHRKRDSILAGDFEPRFPLRWMHKDLFLASITAYDANVPIPMVHTAKEVFASARNIGNGELDYSAVCKAEKCAKN